MNRDQIFAHPLTELIDFEFDEQVVNVFPDMIKRSVPGYAMMIGQVEPMTRRYAQPGTNCYDLGCSLGAATWMMLKGLQHPCSIIAVDNSPAMIKRCQTHLDKLSSEHDHNIELVCADIEDTYISNASVVLLNFTLQFIPVNRRKQIIQTIYDGLTPGGILMLSEKIYFSDADTQDWMTMSHHDFKRQNGYSDLEISQKRAALENILIPETLTTHNNRLQKAGFANIHPWFQCFNFISIVAQKK